jgi:hypothetical protein
VGLSYEVNDYPLFLTLDTLIMFQSEDRKAIELNSRDKICCIMEPYGKKQDRD